MIFPFYNLESVTCWARRPVFLGALDPDDNAFQPIRRDIGFGGTSNVRVGLRSQPVDATPL
jgi:hypothetical protein